MKPFKQLDLNQIDLNKTKRYLSRQETARTRSNNRAARVQAKRNRQIAREQRLTKTAQSRYMARNVASIAGAMTSIGTKGLGQISEVKRYENQRDDVLNDQNSSGGLTSVGDVVSTIGGLVQKHPSGGQGIALRHSQFGRSET